MAVARHLSDATFTLQLKAGGEYTIAFAGNSIKSKVEQLSDHVESSKKAVIENVSIDSQISRLCITANDSAVLVGKARRDSGLAPS